MRVRIPYVVSADGRWCAYGYPEAQRDPDWSMMEEVADNGADDLPRYQRGWIDVDLQIPTDPPDIEGHAKTEPSP